MSFGEKILERAINVHVFDWYAIFQETPVIFFQELLFKKISNLWTTLKYYI